MRLVRGVMLTREGWYFVFVTCFILGGAVLRDVNLLVILAGMMIGLLLFGWRLGRSSLRSLDIRRVLPHEITAGEPFTVQIDVENTRHRLSSWGLQITDRIRSLDGPDKNWVSGRVALPHVPAGMRRYATYRVILPHRGRYSFSEPRVSSRFPLGLFRCWDTCGSGQTVVVLPRQGKLSRRWQQLVIAEGGGARVSRNQGVVEGEYYGLREWRPGDSKRWIHWRSSAKLSRLSVLQFEQPQRQHLFILLDLYASGRATEQEAGLTELAVAFAATAVGDSARRGMGHLTCCVLGEPARVWSSTASRRLSQEILTHLALVRPHAAVEVPPLTPHLVRRWPQPPQTVVISTRAPTAEVQNWLQQNLGSGGTRAHWFDMGSDAWTNYLAL